MKFTNHHVSDLIIRLRNACQRMHLSVVLPNVRINNSILKLLSDEGYISGFKIENNSIIADLKYIKNDAVIKNITVVSKPSKRIFKSAKNIPAYYNGLGITVVSTSKGILTDSQARQLGVGGEVLCQIF